jgi:hypothetical protein
MKRQFAGAVSDESAEGVFRDLVEKWRAETWFMSSIRKRISHLDYLSIIGLGPAAVPLLLRELEQAPDHWFWALQAITREDPAPPEADFDQMRNAWLAWGRQHGYLFLPLPSSKAV